MTFVDSPGLVDGDMKYPFDVDEVILWLGGSPLSDLFCSHTGYQRPPEAFVDTGVLTWSYFCAVEYDEKTNSPCCCESQVTSVT